MWTYISNVGWQMMGNAISATLATRRPARRTQRMDGTVDVYRNNQLVASRSRELAIPIQWRLHRPLYVLIQRHAPRRFWRRQRKCRAAYRHSDTGSDIDTGGIADEYSDCDGNQHTAANHHADRDGQQHTADQPTTPTATGSNHTGPHNTPIATATSTPPPPTSPPTSTADHHAATNTPLLPTSTPAPAPTQVASNGGFPSTGVLDNFNRANSTNIGSNWTGSKVRLPHCQQHARRQLDE